MTIYDAVIWTYYAAHARRPPDPARCVLAEPAWLGPRARVLDFGGGDGRWAVALAERAALVVVADIDEHALRRVPAHPRLRSVLLDGATLPFRSGAFDLVFVNHVLHHVETLPSLVPELRRVVRARGHLVIVEFHPNAPITRIYRLLSRYRRHPCTFYLPLGLVGLVSGEAFTVEARTLDDSQYMVVGARPGHPGPLLAPSENP